MAGPLVTVVTQVGQKLREMRRRSVEVKWLEEQCRSIVTDLDALRGTVEDLAGQTSPETIDEMARKLAVVRRAADGIFMFALGKKAYPPHQYWISLGKLGDNLEEELAAAIRYFDDVGRRNPSALRSAEHGQVISISIDETDGDNPVHLTG
ncbi:hypothetical protein OHB35_15710 [Streptomyces phaeochromogenes]|uniref:Uncharacterized protein n=1 Tax=Streptomyces phaeochromogenes TaxID=1923 RepID=A0ABZ1H8W0_STRPH|nr:hypothetical protein [Streptomyces phaeochromogenes]WSD14574.1 hypothetical protein OHB35_15710 [Streptomyces phaeochromogenes]